MSAEKMIGYSILPDEQLIELFRRGDGKACEELLVRYKNKVLGVARRFFLSGGETEDLVQEGMCGLYSAMVGYSGGDFSSYALVCIKNRILDAVKASRSSKNHALDGFLPICESEESYTSAEHTPEDALLFGEALAELSGKLKSLLSDLEYRVISLYIDGLTVAEISSELSLNYKQIDNAVTRAKRKIQKIITAED